MLIIGDQLPPYVPIICRVSVMGIQRFIRAPVTLGRGLGYAHSMRFSGAGRSSLLAANAGQRLTALDKNIG